MKLNTQNVGEEIREKEQIKRLSQLGYQATRQTGSHAETLNREGNDMKRLCEAPLKEQDLRAVNAAVEMLRERFPVEKVIVYGSKARGDSEEDSDIDLLLVTSRPIQWRERKANIDALFDIQMTHDAIISILIVTVEEWSGGIFTAFPIYQEIMRDGVLAA